MSRWFPPRAAPAGARAYSFSLIPNKILGTGRRRISAIPLDKKMPLR
jgi:hypothetical protein